MYSSAPTLHLDEAQLRVEVLELPVQDVRSVTLIDRTVEKIDIAYGVARVPCYVKVWRWLPDAVASQAYSLLFHRFEKELYSAGRSIRLSSFTWFSFLHRAVPPLMV